jgi:anti-sigma factor ChrR (cupin superfamily)
MWTAVHGRRPRRWSGPRCWSAAGNLEDATRTELEAHLTLCPGCDQYLEQMRATIDELGHVPVESLSEQAQSDLMSAFRTFHDAGTSTT